MSHDDKLKIAVLIKRFLSTGGAERYALEVTRRLAFNHEVHVFAQEWSYQEKEPIAFHRIPRWIKKPSWLNQILFSYLSNKAVGDAFDIVHSHEKVTHFDVMTIHSPCFRSFLSQEKSLWKKTLLWASVLMSPRKTSWLILEKLQFATHAKRSFIAVSERVKKDVQANYHVPHTSFRIAYPGVDIGLKSPAHRSSNRQETMSKLGISENELTFLFVGTEFERKGLDALLHGLALLRSSRTRLLIAGGGGGKMRKYKNLARKLGLTEQTHFLGLVENVGDLYAMADAFILPTLSDPWAMAPIEAMLSGVPVAISSAEYCGAAEYITNHEAFIIKDPTDPRQIADALLQLMDPIFRAELGQRGQALAKELTWDRTTEATLQAYHEVLRRKHQG